ncbi:MAG: hypothetical protein UZ04_CHB001000228 [Chlorobi bacterium OLB4]|jgi:hypothetical protein|nr:MAG: hypothetical protein UZ04_CHB001000228 [Chlorobi bacterium OLB4]MBW7854879.1 DUF4097 family beta strand repeat protein [Ignavibacteria bacterium]OQY78460.1 MAG: hypothetical protein B6D43_03040 [Ignavibacteriales bacterium UTCHB1]
MKILSLISAICIIAFINSSAQTKNKQYSFKTSPGMTAEIEVTDINIIINSNSSETAKVTVTGNSNADLERIKVFETSGGIKISGENYSSLTDRASTLTIEMLLPDYYNLSVSSNNSNISIHNIDGNKRIRHFKGKIRIENSTGDIDVKTGDGSVDVHNQNGMLEIVTATGDIFLNSVDGESKLITASGDISMNNVGTIVSVETASGSINVNPGLSLQNISLSSISGDITVNLTEQSGVSLRVKTFSGELDIDGGFRRSDSSGALTRSITATIGNGAIQMDCYTISGDIRISK